MKDNDLREPNDWKLHHVYYGNTQQNICQNSIPFLHISGSFSSRMNESKQASDEQKLRETNSTK